VHLRTQELVVVTPPLRPYQRTAVAHLHGRNRAALFLDMGLGKTCICLTALRPSDLPALVVAPKRVAEEVWHVEGEKWRPDLRVGRAIGSPKARDAVLRDPSLDVVVISQENIKDPAIGAREYSTFIIDELSGYGARGARWKAARRIIMRGDVDNVWGLTGTPVPNGYEALWPQMYLLDGGHRLGKTLTVFRQKWFDRGRQLPNGAVYGRKLLPGADKEIMAALEDIAMSMTRKDSGVEVQEPIWNEVTVPLPAKVLALQDRLREELVLDLEDLGLGHMIHTADTAAALGNRLSQISAGFMYEDTELAQMANRAKRVSWLHDERSKAVEEIVDGTGGSPVLVFYRYLPELEMLKKRFKDKLHTPKEDGWFRKWDKGQLPILAAHPKSIGHGLNMQYGGHTAVWTSPTWDLEQWDQGNSRLPRPGQENQVVVHMLTAPGTVDAKIYKALRKKASVQDAFLEYLSSPV
jgi:SNF2 family DNA or RNA helicase